MSAARCAEPPAFEVARVRRIDLTLPTPEENLALEDALLDECDSGGQDPILRFWESPAPFVVLGYAGRAAVEVDLEAAAALHVPVLRRISGGGAVVQGPGCVSYALLLPIDPCGPTTSIHATNQWVMERHRQALEPRFPGRIAVQGVTDLTVDGRKCSGNAQRRRRRWLLFHGTFLVSASLELIGRVLRPPPQAPGYRQGRSHLDFLANLEVPVPWLTSRLSACWAAQPRDVPIPAQRINALVQNRYLRPEWNRIEAGPARMATGP
ncbi:MAG TPA: lipoate--protein ligase family protein [Candidatus Paceibacterota bacterium]|nr:lipoate--protein ligase family protein [Verrucomicrobiota bacterium]HOX01667.1 lipoate--protein ligase family protein [Verrucomicrobiota bacterium]HRZ43899.1 lipoate--protein ligase family protein [Candidatus Paceibacterota bacterium]HRZ91639.1 lipoate--protein ligase family protein [Candidatus Paceibacterota bacterium]